MKIVNITLKAHKQISRLYKHEMVFIYEALEILKDWPDVGEVKSLTNTTSCRLRIGQYRALFDVSKDVVTVTEIKRRNERAY